MENCKFIRLYNKVKESLKNPVLDVRYAVYNLRALFSTGKVEGFTQEQRTNFFKLVKEYNHYVHNKIRDLRKELRNAESPIYENFEESELGSYAGSYCMGYQRNISCEEEKALKQKLEFYEYNLISFEGEVIPNDSTERISLVETIKKSRLLEKILRNDSIHVEDIDLKIIQ